MEIGEYAIFVTKEKIHAVHYSIKTRLCIAFFDGKIKTQWGKKTPASRCKLTE